MTSYWGIVMNEMGAKNLLGDERVSDNSSWIELVLTCFERGPPYLEHSFCNTKGKGWWSSMKPMMGSGCYPAVYKEPSVRRSSTFLVLLWFPDNMRQSVLKTPAEHRKSCVVPFLEFNSFSWQVYNDLQVGSFYQTWQLSRSQKGIGEPHTC